MTPHNRAKKDEVAKIALMPGDPLRAKWIAENYLSEARLINDVRNMLGWTGLYRGKSITVMAHGMGMASMGIYSYELYKFYDVEAIIRIGSAGAYTKDINVGDIIIAEDVSSFSNYASEIGVEAKDNILTASAELIALAQKSAEKLKIEAKSRRVFCSETFYNKYSVEEQITRSRGAKAVEMEGFALYANAALFGKKALMLVTCSDSLVTGASMSAQERQVKLSGMVEIALETALAF